VGHQRPTHRAVALGELLPLFVVAADRLEVKAGFAVLGASDLTNPFPSDLRGLLPAAGNS